MLSLPPLDVVYRQLCRTLRDETIEHAQASALVFAPHQDDETLGCGGTLVLKARHGTKMAVAFMTDGSTSHAHFISTEELRERRRHEAMTAMAHLSIAAEDIHFLDFPDSKLDGSRADAVSATCELLERHRAQMVYVPYRRDGVSDHEATYQVVIEACTQTRLSTDLCEYPVWAWNCWPWVGVDIARGRGTLAALRRAARSGFGHELWQFRSGVRIDSVLEVKRSVLGHYDTQLRVPPDKPGWPVLGDVAGGAFLRRFFGPYEVFRRTRIRDGMPS